MNNQKSFSESEVVRNFDYITRTRSNSVVLMYGDYSQEPILEIANYVSNELIATYSKKVLVISLDRNIAKTGMIETLTSLNLANEKELGIYIDESKKFYDLIIIVNHTLKNIENTVIPELDIDGAFLVRSNSSIGLKKKRFVTQLVSDANIKIEGVIYAQ